MELEPGYAVLRAAHGNTLDNARERLFWFLCGWLGGRLCAPTASAIRA